MKRQILYVDDEPLILKSVKRCLGEAFPEHEIRTAESALEVRNLFNNGAVSLETIAVVCTDGSLARGLTGWEIVENLREMGYDGPAVYTGVTILPQEKEPLYSRRCEKLGVELIETIREVLG